MNAAAAETFATFGFQGCGTAFQPPLTHRLADRALFLAGEKPVSFMPSGPVM
jgi:hypothetical protein